MAHDFPPVGMTADEIFALLDAHRFDDVRWHWGRAFRGPEDVQQVAKNAFDLFASDNGLFSLRNPAIGDVETELTDWCAALMHPPAGGSASAVLTSGGTESIFSAIHAMREWAREHKPDAKAPEVIAPYSAHPSLSKACHYLGVTLTRTDLGEDLRADPQRFAAGIGPNTIGLFASAPCWPYGLYDPIDKIGELADQHKLWLHVDACIGGYLSPFLEALGHQIPPWDFRVPAVRSISADLHKLGWVPKPASTVIWRSAHEEAFHHVQPGDWPGGTYAMRGFAGSRTAGPIFAAWAVIRYLGFEGYTRLAGELWDKRRLLIDGVNAIDGLRAWENELLPVAIEGTDVELPLVKEAMSARGWVLLGCADPPLIHLPLDLAASDEMLEPFLAELADAVAHARTAGGSGEALTY